MLSGTASIAVQKSEEEIKALIEAIKELTSPVDVSAGDEQYTQIYENYREALDDEITAKLILREYFNQSEAEFLYNHTQTINLAMDITLVQKIFFEYQKKISCTYFFMKYVLAKYSNSELDLKVSYSELLLSNTMNYIVFGQTMLNYPFKNDADEYRESIQKVKSTTFLLIQNNFYIFNQFRPQIGYSLEDVLNERIQLSPDVLAKRRNNLYRNYTHLFKINIQYFLLCNEYDKAHCDKRFFDLARFLVAVVKTHIEKLAKISNCDLSQLIQEANNSLTYISKIAIKHNIPEKIPFEIAWLQLDKFASSFDKMLESFRQLSFKANLNFSTKEVNELKKQIEAILNIESNLLLVSPEEKSPFSKSLELCTQLRQCSKEQAKILLPLVQRLLAKWLGIFKKADSPFSILNAAVLEKLCIKVITVSLKINEKPKEQTKTTVVQPRIQSKNNTNDNAAKVKAENPPTPLKKQPREHKPDTEPQVHYYSSTNDDIYSNIKKIKEPKVKSEQKTQKQFIVGKTKNNSSSPKHNTNKASKNKKQENKKIQSDNSLNPKVEKENKESSLKHVSSKVDAPLSKENIAKRYDAAKLPLKKVKRPEIKCLSVNEIDLELNVVTKQLAQVSLVENHLAYVPTDRVIAIDSQVKTILRLLNDFGYWAVVRGGAVRDSILGLAVADWDISTNCPKELLRGFLPQANVNLQDETQRQFKIENKIDITCTTFSLEEELEQQDFYENTLCADSEGRVYDILKVLTFFKEDSPIKQLHVIPKENNASIYDRFAEDPTILMRYFRLSEKLNWNISLNFKALNKIVGFLTNIQHGKYLSNFAKLFNAGKASKLWDILASHDLTHSFMPGAQRISYSYDLGYVSNFIRNKFKLIDHCSQTLRDQQYGFYHSVSLFLLPQLVERLCTDPNGTIDKKVEDTIDYYCNNFRGEFKEGDKHCFRVNVKQALPRYYLEYWQNLQHIQANMRTNDNIIESKNEQNSNQSLTHINMQLG